MEGYDQDAFAPAGDHLSWMHFPNRTCMRLPQPYASGCYLSYRMMFEAPLAAGEWCCRSFLPPAPLSSSWAKIARARTIRVILILAGDRRPLLLWQQTIFCQFLVQLVR